jgi:hypothetical protein
MKSDILTLFGCPISLYNNTFYLNEKEIDFLKKQEMDDFNNVVVKTSKNKKILHNIELQRIKNLIDQYANDYVDKVLAVNDKFYLTHSWLVISEKNEPHHEHYHQSSIFSVVYYIQADNASITFNGDKNFLTRAFNFDFNYKNYNQHNSIEVKVPVKTGQIIIFPGNIKHSANNYSDNKKVVLGANYFVKGTIGVYEKTTSVDL